MSDDQAVARVLAASGVGFPRGVLGPEIRALAALPDDAPAERVERFLDAAATAHWATLRAPIRAALGRARAKAPPGDHGDFDRVLALSEDEDPGGPLARALVVSAALDLRRAATRARGHLDEAERAVAGGGPAAAVAASRAAGAAAVDLLDLDPEDFEPEIVAYAAADGDADAIAELARSTGDPDVRGWARAAVGDLDAPDAPRAVEAVRALAAGPPPEDPAEDLVWVPAILTLAQAGIEQVAAGGSSAPVDALPSEMAPPAPDPGPDGPDGRPVSRP